MRAFLCGKIGVLRGYSVDIVLPILKNQKWEEFTQKWVETSSKTDAYKLVYPNSKKWKDRAVSSRAYELSKKPKVEARYKELQKMAEKKHNITIESLLAELDENRRIALGAETPQCSAANQSTMSKAKLAGLDQAVQDKTTEQTMAESINSLIDRLPS